MKSVKILLISIITIFLSSLAHAELNINRVITSVEGSGKWITVRTSFYNVDSDNVTEIFRMGIDGNLENGDFHALRFDERSFRIPKEYSFESQPGRFFFADFSVNSGAFRNLYNYLDTKNQANIEAACNYMNNSKVIDKILKTKSSNNAHGPFLANQKTKKSLSYLLNLCVQTSAKVHTTDVQQKFSFQGVSYNGDIKAEQFNFSDVKIKARSNTDRVNIKVIFQDVSTPYKVSDKEETVDITFEGDPKSETVYALRLSYGTFSQTIPSSYSYEGKSSRFLISPRSIQDGTFNSLYEQLTAHDKTKLKGVCNYFLDDNNIEEIISLKPPSGTNVIGKGFGSGVVGKENGSGKGAARINKLLSNPDVSRQIKALATLCFDATNRVYVKDVQTFLNASEHDVGKSDGQWGKKSQKGWEAYLTSQGKPLDTTIDATSIQELQKSIISKIPKLREITFNDDYFDTKHEIRNHKEPNYGNLCKFIGCPAVLKKKNQIRKVIKDKGNKPFQNSKYIKAITKEQWNTIKDIGDPQNCYERLSTLDKIKTGAVINQKIYAQNKNSIRQSLNKNRVVFLNNGVFQLDKTINLDGKILIGSEKTILDASLLETGVIVSNGTLKNVRIINAKKIGVSVIKNSNLHNVIIENTGVGVEDNSKGHGVSILGENSTGNCLVSVEAYNGYNKAGDNCCKNGGNADGFQIKYGANGVTLVDTHGHHNSDDGFDLWKSGHDAPIKKEDIIIRFYYSSANLNGKNPLTPDGDGNGFKLGSRDKYQAPKKDKGARLIYGSVACYNKLNGFDRNGTKMKIFAGRLQATGNGAEQFRDITRYMNTPADPYTLKCKMFPRN